MQEIKKNFNHLKIHSQYSICEGAIIIDNLKDFCKKNKIQSIGLSDSSNLSGALEFSEKVSKSGTQPIIGTQIIFKYKDTYGYIPLIALNYDGYKKIIELSSKSYLENTELTEPFCNFNELLKNLNGISLLSGSINSLSGKLFNMGRNDDVIDIYKKLQSIYKEVLQRKLDRVGGIEKELKQFVKNQIDTLTESASLSTTQVPGVVELAVKLIEQIALEKLFPDKKISMEVIEYLRDKNGTLQLPLLMLKRTTIDRNELSNQG